MSPLEKVSSGKCLTRLEGREYTDGTAMNVGPGPKQTGVARKLAQGLLRNICVTPPPLVMSTFVSESSDRTAPQGPRVL